MDVFAPSSKYLYPLCQILPPQPKHKSVPSGWCIDLSNQALLINSQVWLLVDITKRIILHFSLVFWQQIILSCELWVCPKHWSHLLIWSSICQSKMKLIVSWTFCKYYSKYPIQSVRVNHESWITVCSFTDKAGCNFIQPFLAKKIT